MVERFEPASGKDTNRPQLRACLDYVREGDELVVHSTDRLSRSTVDMLKTVEDLTGRRTYPHRPMSDPIDLSDSTLTHPTIASKSTPASQATPASPLRFFDAPRLPVDRLADDVFRR
jgi:hypothetical protein